jgi:hypothetical protein
MRRKENDMKLNINFGEYEHCLWNTGSDNFMHKPEHKGRFVLLEGKKHTGKSGYMYFQTKT